MMTGEPIAVDDPGKPDVRALLERHRAFALGPIKFLGPDHAELKSMQLTERAADVLHRGVCECVS